MEIDRPGKFDGVLLRGVALRSEVLPSLASLTLLHAGPPFSGIDTPSPVRNAAIHALIFEHHAETRGEAAILIDSGKVSFEPAQDWGVVTPLAQVISASMPLFVIGDDKHQAFAPVVEGAPVGLRFGSSDPECLENLRTHTQFARLELDPQLNKTPVRIAAVIEKALAEGNECHSLTDSANAAFLEQLDGLSGPYRSLLENSPGFVLPIIMGACSWWLQFGSASHDNGNGVVAVGGNGVSFGIRLRGRKHWSTATAKPPTGNRFPRQENRPVVGAIGDSAVVDFCGLGGQALDCAPSLVSEWQKLLPEDWQIRPECTLCTDTGVVSPTKVIQHQRVPIINLALVSADAMGGILGKGFYEPDLAVFETTTNGATP